METANSLAPPHYFADVVYLIDKSDPSVRREPPPQKKPQNGSWPLDYTIPPLPFHASFG